VGKSKQTFYILKILSENLAFCEEMWKNMVQQDTDDNKMWLMLIEHCVTKTTDSHSEYIIYIAFPRQN